MPNPIVYFEIAGLDSNLLKQFYSDVFDWNMDGKFRQGYGFIPTVEPGGILWGN